MARLIINNRLTRGVIPIVDENIPYEILSNESPIGILLCPADPMKGGSMNDPIIKSLFLELDKYSYNVMRFNYLKSPIFKENYEKYIRQTSYCVDEFFKETNIKYLILVGFSFGAVMALNVALRRTSECIGFVLLSPPLLNYDMYSWVISLQLSGLIVNGEQDAVIPPHIVELYAKFLKAKNMTISSVTLPEEGHLLSEEAVKVTIEYIEALLNQ